MKSFRFAGFSLLLLISCSLVSCWGFHTRPDWNYSQKKRWAWKPVYALDTSYRKIGYTDARPVVNAGKIYVKDNLIYQCEVGDGIHVTNNSNPATAQRVGFISVPGCEEISIKGNVLYTNNHYDLIAIDISRFQSPRVISRTTKAFYGNTGMQHTWEQPKDSGYYQCPRTYTDSVIVRWVKDSIIANCYK